MYYFARISNRYNPANRLQGYILEYIKRFDQIGLEEPEKLLERMQEFTRQANRAYPRCTAQACQPHRNHKTKALESISMSGVFTLTIFEIKGTFKANPTESEKPAEAPAPVQAVPIAVTKTPPESDKPRQVIQKSREDDTPLKFEYWTMFAPAVQQLLKNGNIWAVYQSPKQIIVAEEFGGTTHVAY